MSNSPHSQVEAAQKLSSVIRMKFCSGRNLGKALNSTKKAISCLRLSREQINHSEVYVIYLYWKAANKLGRLFIVHSFHDLFRV